MASDNSSHLLGEYFRHIVRRKTENSAYGTIHGTGKPSKNPFTGAAQAFKAPASLARLSAEIKKRKLDQDKAFVDALHAAVADITEEPVSYLLEELGTLQQYGDGGPDPSFELKLGGGEAPDMKQVIESFRKSK